MLTIQHLQIVAIELQTVYITYIGEMGAPIVAGGAPRDILHGAPVKDIDCFVQIDPTDVRIHDAQTASPDAPQWVHSEPFESMVSGLVIKWGGSATITRSPAEYGSIANFAQIDGSKWGVPVQIIGIEEDPTEDVFQYDFGLSQVLVRPNGLMFTDAYIADDIGGTITYLETDPTDALRIERSRARYLRLREKYPTRAFINCEKLEVKNG